MNYIACFLLFVYQNDESVAFNVFNNLMKGFVKNLYKKDFS